MRTAQIMRANNSVGSLFLEGGGTLAAERGLINAALATSAKTEPRALGQIQELRKRSENVLDAALDQVRSAPDFPGKGPLMTRVEAIVGAAREQSVGLGEINEAVNLMDQSAQQNAAMVEESSAASHSLAAEAAALTALLARFRFTGGNVTPRPVVALEHKPVPRRVAASAR